MKSSVATGDDVGRLVGGGVGAFVGGGDGLSVGDAVVGEAVGSKEIVGPFDSDGAAVGGMIGLDDGLLLGDLVGWSLTIPSGSKPTPEPRSTTP